MFGISKFFNGGKYLSGTKLLFLKNCNFLKLMVVFLHFITWWCFWFSQYWILQLHN